MKDEMRTGGLFIFDVEAKLRESLNQIVVNKDIVQVTFNDPENDLEHKTFEEPTIEAYFYDFQHAPEHKLNDRIKKPTTEGDRFLVQDYPTPYWLWYYFILHSRRFDDMKELYEGFLKVVRPRGAIIVNNHKLMYEMIRHENRDDRSKNMYKRVFIHKFLSYIFDGEIEVLNRYSVSVNEIETSGGS